MQRLKCSQRPAIGYFIDTGDFELLKLVERDLHESDQPMTPDERRDTADMLSMLITTMERNEINDILSKR